MADGIKKAGGISFGVSMYTSKLKKDIAVARQSIGGFVSSTAKSLSKLTGMFGGVGGALTAGSLVWGIKQSIDRIDQLNTKAKTLGTTTDALSRLGYVADQAESSQESLAKGMARVGRATDDVAVRGVREMADLYAKLGVNAQDLAKLAPDQQFLKIGEAIGKLNNSTDQLVATQRIFGRSSGDLVNIFRLSREELAKLTAEADKFGITVSQKNAERIAQANDAINKLASAWGGLKNELAIAATPAITAAANAGANELRNQRGLWAWIQHQIKPYQQVFGDSAPGLRPVMRNDIFGTKSEPPSRAAYDSLATGGGLLRQKLLRNLLGTPKQIWEGLSSPIAIAQRKLAMQEISRASSTFTERGPGMLERLLGGISNFAPIRNLIQAGQGIANSPLAQLQRQLFGANLQAGMAGGISPMGRGAQHTVGSFDAVESGSLAAYQQRIRGAQQFNKVQDKQLAAQERMASALDSIDAKTVEWGRV